jgi:hypothetical protein
LSRLSGHDEVEIAAVRGWTIAQVFIDRPTTVRKALERRPGEAALRDRWGWSVARRVGELPGDLSHGRVSLWL